MAVLEETPRIIRWVGIHRRPTTLCFSAIRLCHLLTIHTVLGSANDSHEACQSTSPLKNCANQLLPPPVVWTRQDTWREIDVHCASCESGASGTAKPRGEEDGHLTIAFNAFNIWELRATKINMKEDRFVLNTPTSCFASSRCLCMLLFPPTGCTNALCDNKINRIPPSCRPDSEFLARCLGHHMPASASMRYEIVSCSVAPCVMTLAECRDWMSEGPFDTITEYQLSGSLRRISHCKYVKPRQTIQKSWKNKTQLLICIPSPYFGFTLGIIERVAGSPGASPIITGLDTPISISTAAQNGAEMLDVAMATETWRGDNA